jgi:diguanylate cyclase (GGDEF)-like protein
MIAIDQQRLTAIETKAIIEALENAIIEHGKWLTNWHRDIMCTLPLNDDIILENAHRITNFGRWYYSKQSQILSEHPEFEIIDKVYQRLHVSARKLALKAQAGKTITKIDYDSFLAKEVELSEILIKLRDEFHEALFSFDSLTHVLNRQAFLRILAQEHARAFRTGKPCCLAMVDLDNFKNINDTYGHQAGDTTLQLVAQYLTENLRPYDSMCRYGGEEFLICLPHTLLDLAKKIVTRLQKGLANYMISISRKKIISITASFGLAVTEQNVSMIDTITRADSAMYAAKHEGGNRVITWGDKA